MILHIAPDDKFIPFLIDLFEEAGSGQNIWRIRTNGQACGFIQEQASVAVVGRDYFWSRQFQSDLAAVNCLVFHSLDLALLEKRKVLSSLSDSVLLIWRGWGFDYYPYLEAGGLKILGKETQNVLIKLKRKVPAVERIHNRFRGLAKKALFHNVEAHFFQRVDGFSCCVPSDHLRLREALPGFTSKFVPLNYYSKEDVFLRGEVLGDLTGQDVLVGNSATPTNNHAEVLMRLNEIGVVGRKIFAPLSYGDVAYRSEIVELGRRLLGDSFCPMVDYMPLARYNEFISSCGNVVMNHVRQQAIGNISAALFRGGKVFLSKKNPIYKYYDGLGVKVFSIEEDLSQSNLSLCLSESVVRKNKEILSDIWTRQRGVEQARTLLEAVRAK